MPTYNYKCLSCKKKFVAFQTMNEGPILSCVVCSSDKVEKLISAGSGLIFKGAGFYLTDYKEASKKTRTMKLKQKIRNRYKYAKSKHPTTRSKNYNFKW